MTILHRCPTCIIIFYVQWTVRPYYTGALLALSFSMFSGLWDHITQVPYLHYHFLCSVDCETILHRCPTSTIIFYVQWTVSPYYTGALLALSFSMFSGLWNSGQKSNLAFKVKRQIIRNMCTKLQVDRKSI